MELKGNLLELKGETKSTLIVGDFPSLVTERTNQPQAVSTDLHNTR